MKIRVWDLTDGTSEKNGAKLKAALDDVQKNARVRTVTAGEIYVEIAGIQKKLDKLMPKKAQVGVVAEIDRNAQDFPNAYKGKPESTKVRVEKTSTGWFVTNVTRGYCKSASHRIDLILTDDHRAAIADYVTQYRNW